MKYLIAGLGNIGSEYANTRHNVGFMVLDAISKKNDFSFHTDRLADVAEFKQRGKTFLFIKPSTFMNLSGKAIHYWLQKEKIQIDNLLVVFDDLSLPLGTLRMRKKGSDAGHNGLKNIRHVLETEEYARLKVGIGNEFNKGHQIAHVLGAFKTEELTLLNETLDKCIPAVFDFAFLGIDKAMNIHNTAG